MVDIFFFDISHQTGNFQSRQILKYVYQFDRFADRIIYFWNKLFYQVKNNNEKKKKN